MDGIVRVRTIAFTPDRMPTLRRIRLGYEGDNLVERLEFDLPEITQSQTATLMITGADAVKLDRTDEGRYAVDLTRDMIGPDGEREAYVRIDGTGEKVWQSTPMRLITGALPDAEEEVEKVYPTAVGQMLTAMAEHSGEMEAQEERVEQAAQRAEDAAERAEAGGGGGGGSGSTVEIDATLTHAGKAADAKATGEAVSKLYKEMTDQFADRYTKAETDAAISEATNEGRYELIETINISEDTASIERTTEPNGTPYNYKSILLKIYFRNDAHSYNKYTLMEAIFGETSLVVFRSNEGTPTGEQVIRTYREYGYVRGEISGVTTNVNHLSGGFSVYSSHAHLLTENNITQIILTEEEGFMVDDVIQIWGVRA